MPKALFLSIKHLSTAVDAGVVATYIYLAVPREMLAGSFGHEGCG